MMKRAYRITLLALLLPTSFAGAEEPPVVMQEDKSFSVSHLVVEVGSSVEFKNNDPFFHNVFSLSPAATFDLGSYPKDESKTVTFTEPGIVEVECAIHPSMRMKVEVTE